MTTDATLKKFTPGGAYAFHAEGSALIWDYARALICLAILIGVLGIMSPGGGWWITVALLVVFAGYLANVIYRHGLKLELDDRGLTAGWRNPMDPTGLILAHKRTLSWDQLDNFCLRYFSRTKFTQNGWTMVRLEGAGGAGTPLVITFDGDHEGFKPVLLAAWSTAQRRGLEIDEATLANLALLDISLSEDNPWMS